MARRYWYALSVPTLGFEEVTAAMDVLQGGRTTMGECVEEFEEEFARHVGARHAVMVNSGSSADLLVAFAAYPTPGQRVLISAVTWPTHVWSWHMAGHDIVFVDVDGLNVDRADLEEKVRSDDDMYAAVHLMGVPADLTDVPCQVTEDCCEALGSVPVGRVGEMATWSFFFSHHMTTMEGGMVTTDDPHTASLLRSLRSHGWARHEGRDPYEFVTPGFNVRPTEVAAAIGLVQLGKIDKFNKHRAENRDLFIKALAGNPAVELPEAPAGTSPAWFGLPLFVNPPAKRDKVAAALNERGVETRPILGGNLLRQPAFKQWAGQGPLPGADRVHDRGLYIGLHPLPDTGIEEVAHIINEVTA